jgi:hypothetical protein
MDQSRNRARPDMAGLSNFMNQQDKKEDSFKNT